MILLDHPPVGVWPKKEWRSYLDEREELLDAIFYEATKQGITDAELAEKSGLAYTTVYDIHEGYTGQPRLSTIWKLAKAIGMTLTLQRLQAVRRTA